MSICAYIFIIRMHAKVCLRQIYILLLGILGLAFLVSLPLLRTHCYKLCPLLLSASDGSSRMAV